MPKYLNNNNTEAKNVLHFHKSLYGLNHASRKRHNLKKAEFESLNMMEQRAAPCIFLKENMTFVCYVDDLLIFEKEQQKLISWLTYCERNSSPRTWVCRVISSESQLIDQRRMMSSPWVSKAWTVSYAKLRTTNMSIAKGMNTPIIQQTQTKEGVKLVELLDVTRHRSIIRTLLYLATKSRPDLSVAATILGWYVEKPYDNHLVFSKRALQYLKNLQYGNWSYHPVEWLSLAYTLVPVESLNKN